MVIAKKKVAKRKKVLKLKKGGKRVVERKGVKASKPKYTLIRVSAIPDYVLNKIKDGSKVKVDTNHYCYYNPQGRFRRWFDWANSIFKIVSEVKTLDRELISLIEDRIPVQYQCYIEALANSQNVIKRQLVDVEELANHIRRSIFFMHGTELNIEYNEATEEYEEVRPS